MPEDLRFRKEPVRAPELRALFDTGTPQDIADGITRFTMGPHNGWNDGARIQLHHWVRTALEVNTERATR